MKMPTAKKSKFEISQKRAFQRRAKERQNNSFPHIVFDVEARAIIEKAFAGSIQLAMQKLVEDIQKAHGPMGEMILTIECLIEAIDNVMRVKDVLEVDYERDVQDGYSVDEAWAFLAERKKKD